MLRDYLTAADKNLHDFIRIKVDFFNTFNYQDYGSILNIESRQTIIDQFVAFKQVARLLLCQKEALPKYKIGTVKQIIRRLRPQIQNDEILRVLSVFSDLLPRPIQSDIEFLEIVDLYTTGLYSRVVEIAPVFIRKNPSYYHAILLYVKSVINTNQTIIPFSNNNSIVDQVIGHIYTILKKDNNFDFECFGDAYKFLHQLGDHPLSNGLYYLLSQELPYRFDGERDINLFKFYFQGRLSH